ncbi:hypothetical protein AgCh_006399 [Apium graveolens]
MEMEVLDSLIIKIHNSFSADVHFAAPIFSLSTNEVELLDVFFQIDFAEMQRAALIEWINTTLSNVKLPVHSSDDELRALLLDGSVLCRLLNKLRPGSVSELRGSDHPSKLGVENVGRFLVAIDQMAFPRFQVHDLQKGSKPIVDPYGLSDSSPCGENYIPTILEEQKRKVLFSERVACLLRKVIQEIERRMSTQAEHIRTQNNLFRAREERYQSRIRVLEALASGTNEEAQVLQKLLEANPGLNIDMTQICGTISGDTGGADGVTGVAKNSMATPKIATPKKSRHSLFSAFSNAFLAFSNGLLGLRNPIYGVVMSCADMGSPESWTTCRVTTGATPFMLAYGVEAVISVEISHSSPRIQAYNAEENEEGQSFALELIDEVRDKAHARIEEHQKRLLSTIN